MIDTHTHIFTEEAYASYAAKATGRVEKIVTIHYSTAAAAPKHSLQEVLALAEKHADIAVVASINILHDIPQQLDTCRALLEEKKIVGIKMYPGYQHFYPSDPLVLPVAKLCTEYHRPLIFHSGDVSPRGSAKLKYSVPLAVDDLATEMPDCPVVIAHFGFPYLLEAAAVINKNKNVYTDISGTIDSQTNGDDMQKLAAQYRTDLARTLAYYPAIADRVMFGTDYGGEHTHLKEVDAYIDTVASVFTKKDQDLVFRQTAEKLFF